MESLEIKHSLEAHRFSASNCFLLQQSRKLFRTDSKSFLQGDSLLFAALLRAQDFRSESILKIKSKQFIEISFYSDFLCSLVFFRICSLAPSSSCHLTYV